MYLVHIIHTLGSVWPICGCHECLPCSMVRREVAETFSCEIKTYQKSMLAWRKSTAGNFIFLCLWNIVQHQMIIVRLYSWKHFTLPLCASNHTNCRRYRKLPASSLSYSNFDTNWYFQSSTRRLLCFRKYVNLHSPTFGRSWACKQWLMIKSVSKLHDFR